MQTKTRGNARGKRQDMQGKMRGNEEIARENAMIRKGKRGEIEDTQGTCKETQLKMLGNAGHANDMQ